MLRNLSEIYDTTRIASVRIADIQANMSRTDSARYGIKTLFKRPPIECPLSSNLIVRSGSAAEVGERLRAARSSVSFEPPGSANTRRSPAPCERPFRRANRPLGLTCTGRLVV